MSGTKITGKCQPKRLLSTHHVACGVQKDSNKYINNLYYSDFYVLNILVFFLKKYFNLTNACDVILCAFLRQLELQWERSDVPFCVAYTMLHWNVYRSLCTVVGLPQAVPDFPSIEVKYS